jgi:hypothetical protein
MADCLVDLVLRPGSRSAVRADVTLTVPVGTVLGGNEPGEIDGQVIDAVTVRETCYALGLLPRPAAGGHVPDRGDPAAPDPADTERPGREHAAPRESEAAEGPDDGSGGPPPAEAGEAVVGEPGTSLSDAERQRREDLGRWILGTFRATGDAAAEEAGRPPRIALVDELTGQLLALTGGRELLRAAACGRPACRRRPHRCTHTDHLVDPVTGVPTGRRSGIGPPPPTDGYRPGAALDRFVRARDRHCRFPGCRRRAGTDLDHTVPWPAGPTCCENLAALCRHHHRLSHQAPGWRLEPTGDGGLRWTLPGGHTRVTHPPAYGSDDDQPPDPLRDAGIPTDAGPPVDTAPPADAAPPARDEAPPF